MTKQILSDTTEERIEWILQNQEFDNKKFELSFHFNLRCFQSIRYMNHD